jgi:hypothetical protein
LGGCAVINIQARTITDNLASLVKELNTIVDSVEDKKGSETKHAFFVYLTNDPDAAEKELETFAEKHQITKIPLTLFDGEAGPPNYEIAKEADVTIMMWKDKEIKVNCAFAADQLDKNAVKSVLEKAREHVKAADEETDSES